MFFGKILKKVSFFKSFNIKNNFENEISCGVVVIIWDFESRDGGSIPPKRKIFFILMRGKIINIQIHPLQYPNQGQNYVFNGCMNFLMECMKENKEYDYWFFSALSGDCFVQVFNVNKQKWSTCFSQSKFDYQLIKRVFDPIGYDFIYIEPEEWKKNKASIKEKIIQYIDKGVPIIAKGFQSIVKGIQLPTNEVSCIVSYDTDRQHFYRMTEETTDLITFSLDDPLPYIFVFPGKKIKESESIASIYRSALINAPKLMHTPPCDDNDVFLEMMLSRNGQNV